VEDVVFVTLELRHLVIIIEVLVTDDTEGVASALNHRAGDLSVITDVELAHSSLSLLSAVLSHLVLHFFILCKGVLVVVHMGEFPPSRHVESHSFAEARCEAETDGQGADMRT